jgi:Zn-dependent peptidase ImmA (M78 family)
LNVTDPSQFKAPRIAFSDIRSRADNFRNKYWGSKDVPVDILLIAEEKLNIEFVPIVNFKTNNDFEALLFDHGTKLAIDEKEYMDDRYLNRVRFSVAHEIAHIVLHKDLYDSFSFDTVDEWMDTLEALPDDEYNWIEQQANEFAGRLLIPQNRLEQLLKEIQPQIKLYKSKFPESDPNQLKEYVSSNLCKVFGVSGSVLARRIDKENLGSYL